MVVTIIVIRNMKLKRHLLPPPPYPSTPCTYNYTCTIVAIVGHCDLSATNLDDILRRHALSDRMRGIRHMLNFHPDYPQYSEAKHDDFLTDKQWIEGFALLEKYRMSFEMHILPVQMKR